jgi:hypothetical protein
MDFSLRSEPSPCVNITEDCHRLAVSLNIGCRIPFAGGLFAINGALRSCVERELGQAGFV